jgi:CheY-like chemotaxis protein
MPRVLLIDADTAMLATFESVLNSSGYHVRTALSGSEGLELLSRQTVDIIVAELRLPDISGLEVLRRTRRAGRKLPFIILAGPGSTKDAVTAMQLGASDFLDKPISADDLVHIFERSFRTIDDGTWSETLQDDPSDFEGHAAARWARALISVIGSPKDPRTVTGWSRCAAASPGTLRNWCRTAGISPRRSLVLGRLLRVVLLSKGGRHKPEDLLDVVDLRTLCGLLRLAGFGGGQGLPGDIKTFLERQTLVRDPDALREIKRALESNVFSRARARALITGSPTAGRLR